MSKQNKEIVYENITDKSITLRVDNRTSQYNKEFVTVEPGKKISLPEGYSFFNEGLKLVDSKPVTPKEPAIELTEATLKKLTKDQLNDLAAENGLKEEVNSGMNKSKMIETILKLVNK